ncbi:MULTISPECIES: DUF3794 domain-containing protein [Sporomusa]|jgi:hypothetical protein|uniref:SipL SPOCS domain-containing protein n=2 Tax=Sporomusa TaxID=2375 RepID=A0ABP2C9U7_9FIRM|nr:DUF3794 domain-containing protein [Sporomusa sphaeroides]MCM0760344.1 DUF3794 domain-containing protein [Sporomusa sphaeroides DSM 2875]OLS54218.1 hypothetical protein SPSPH_47010 [Sporomusa sphaeroides DSM 2875]CVK20611.1 hypothetical protein SSPH_03279 [Sporomusa sphaeroides DSM 2875]HML33337.1 DUF3794 domain-containing protein [Sporomusa sphaeroides]
MSRRYHRKSRQFMIGDTLTIPQDKPDIEFLLRMTAVPTIDKATGADKKVIFSGHVLVTIEYVACVPDGTQPIHFVSFEQPFTGAISHRSARPDRSIHLKGLMEVQELQLVGPRQVKTSLQLKVCSVKLVRCRSPLPTHAGEA